MIYQTYPWKYYSGCTLENRLSRKQGDQLGFCNIKSGKNNDDLHWGSVGGEKDEF